MFFPAAESAEAKISLTEAALNNKCKRSQLKVFKQNNFCLPNCFTIFNCTFFTFFFLKSCRIGRVQNLFDGGRVPVATQPGPDGGRKIERWHPEVCRRCREAREAHQNKVLRPRNF